MKVGVFGRLYVWAWAETRIVVAARGNDAGRFVGVMLIGPGKAMRGLWSWTEGVGVVGEMSILHKCAPKGSRK